MALRRLVEAYFVHFCRTCRFSRYLRENEHRVCKLACLQAGDVSDFLAIYARMNIGFVNLRVCRQGMCEIFSLFTLE